MAIGVASSLGPMVMLDGVHEGIEAGRVVPVRTDH